ncbi:MAG: amidohydrolase family protein [Gammaproteobacteria bacterium]|nr:MAG: amidohydrolase family protein [Gammaproteobacteria bacterium]
MHRFSGLIASFAIAILTAFFLAACSDRPALDERVQSPAGSTLVALVGGTLIDGTGGVPVDDAVVLIESDRIACAGPSSDCGVPDSARLIDVSGRWITPGIVDAHVHFDQTAWGDGRPDALDVRSIYPFEAVEFRQRTMPERYLRAYLCSGVTAVFDVGGFPWTWTLRDRVRGDPFAPHVAAAGPLISHVSPPKWVLPAESRIIELNDEESGRAGVRYLAANHTDAIKVWFLAPSQDMRDELDARLSAVGDEAATYGVQLLVHATRLREAKVALRAGARLLVHSVQDEPVDAEFLEMLTDPAREVIYTPTLAVRGGYVRMYESVLTGDPPPDVDDPNRCVDQDTLAKIAQSAESGQFGRFDRERLDAYADRAAKSYQVMAGNLMAVHQAGGTIAMGTDAGNPLTVAGPSIHAEMEAMQAAGMPAIDVIVAATLNSARAMQREGEIGTVEAGKIADLLVLGADPSQDVANFRQLEAVIRGGRFHAQVSLRRPERGVD